MEAATLSLSLSLTLALTLTLTLTLTLAQVALAREMHALLSFPFVASYLRQMEP